MVKWMLTATAVAALAIPAAAAAKAGDVSGKAVELQGRAFLRAELSSAGADPVEVTVPGGFVRLVDLGGDMKAQCDGKSRTRQNAKGDVVVICLGSAQVAGSHFRLHGFAPHYGISIPDGYTGKVKGRAGGRDGAAAPAAGAGGSSSGASSTSGAAAVSTIDAALAAALKK